MNYELFVEVVRNKTIESRHFGAAVVCDAQGAIVKRWGDINQLIFPRSAIKPLIAINLIESGACDHYKLTDAELTIACSSHRGEQIHQHVVASWLYRLDLNEAHLYCGPTLPDDAPSAHHLISVGQDGCQVHHTCSGKHTGLLATAKHLNLSLNDYHRLEHPLQQQSLDLIDELASCNLRINPMGIDGCGLPAPTMTLLQLARAMANFANPTHLSTIRMQAIYRLHRAMTNEPLYLCGHNSLISDLVSTTQGAILAKNGAEGIITASIPKKGLGIALKIADGNERASSVALMAILDHLNLLTHAEKNTLQPHISPKILNSRLLPVGHIQPCQAWLSQF